MGGIALAWMGGWDWGMYQAFFYDSHIFYEMSGCG